jgi:hypothetical protein
MLLKIPLIVEVLKNLIDIPQFKCERMNSKYMIKNTGKTTAYPEPIFSPPCA